MLCLRTRAAAGEDLHLSLGSFGIRRGMAECGEHFSWQRARHAQPAGDAAASSEQDAAKAPCPIQCQDRRGCSLPGTEPLRKVQDPARLSPAERIDRLVGIPHDNDIPPLTGDDLQQPHLRGIGVLIFVHKNAADLVAQRCRDLAPGQQYAAPVHQFGVVEHPLGVQNIKVFVEEGPKAHPLRSIRAVSRRDNVLRIHAQLTSPGQHATNLAGERPRGKGPRKRLGPLGATRFQAPAKCLSDPELLLRSGQQPQRCAEPVRFDLGLIAEATH